MDETERRVHRELNVRRDCRHSQREKPGPPFRELGILDYLGIFQNRAVQDLHARQERLFFLTCRQRRARAKVSDCTTRTTLGLAPGR